MNDIIISLPPEAREMLDTVSTYYGIPADFLAQKWLVDCIYNASRETVLERKRCVSELGKDDGE